MNIKISQLIDLIVESFFSKDVNEIGETFLNFLHDNGVPYGEAKEALLYYEQRVISSTNQKGAA